MVEGGHILNPRDIQSGTVLAAFGLEALLTTRRPHKLLFLLTLAKLYEESPDRANAFPLDQLLETTFQAISNTFFSGSAPLMIEYPYYHMTADNVWGLKVRAGMESTFRGYATGTSGRLTRARLKETIDYGYLGKDLDACLRHERRRQGFQDTLVAALSNMRDQFPTNSRIESPVPAVSAGNPFVAYLNSLQRINGSNENALAEYQSCNPMFSTIHVAHPLTEVILKELRAPDGRSVVLTGHAGDGKSTIAVDIFKHLTNVPEGDPLARGMRQREDLKGSNITILKDLSERNKIDDAALVKEVVGGSRRFLIVSNTGALLDLFREQAAIFGIGAVQMESDLLTAISEEQGSRELHLGKFRLLIINLSRIDNLDLAREIFKRMIAPDHWALCAGQPCQNSCPVYQNVMLIRKREAIVTERLFLAYRRMYEYGTRLTLRQITEHLAYLLTSGLDEADLARLRRRNQRPRWAEFLFFNRFFGDDGRRDDAPAVRMKAVVELRRQRFGERPCPTWERKLWLKVCDRPFDLGVADCEQEFNNLRAIGGSPPSRDSDGLSPDQARDQVRRMVYFLHAFPQDDTSYVVQFLNSPSIIRWSRWQKENPILDLTEQSLLEHRIFHVLQEHFTGVRLPEGTKANDRRLYITLSQGKGTVRQSAQVVVAQVDWGETQLCLERHQNVAAGKRTDLELKGLRRIVNAGLILTLPFLDYVLMRHVGEAGEVLQPAYIERLERFKAQLQELAKESTQHVMLVRLKTDHSFRRQRYTVSNGKLEVTDVL